MFFTSAILAFIAGIALVGAGVWGILFTYENVSEERIVTPSDASIPSQPVRGPLTLLAQSEIMREHTLKATKGQTYAQMPRQVLKVDETGNPVVDEMGQTVMIPNEARDIWITSTALRTALHLAIVTYAFSALTILIGFISLWTGMTFWMLKNTTNK